jgi:FtsZ-binding cell division protein ZapB
MKSKEEEIKAFRTFCDAVGQDSYFTELVQAFDQVETNIRSDYSALFQVFVSVDEWREKEEEARALREELRDSQLFDVRLLRDRLTKAVETKTTLQKEIDTLRSVLSLSQDPEALRLL